MWVIQAALCWQKRCWPRGASLPPVASLDAVEAVMQGEPEAPVAAAALWTHRKAVAAIIAGLLVLPVLFIMLLPSLIFGGLTKAGVEGSPDTPILNDNAAIVENINQISQAISDLLEEGQEDVRARIDTDFTASGANQKEIINPYESSPAYNANRFIAMYCAAKNQDYASISLKDMEDVIRKAKDALYTFTSTEESRTTTVTETNTDPKTGKVTVTETEVTEIWKIYTIVYNGEAYFEDKIFALSDEQKGLAENYAQNLSVFLGDGMMQGLLPAESTGLVSLGDIRFSDGATQVVYYNQLDKRYASKPYGTDDIGTYGCGPTCMAMVVSSLTSETVDPVEMACWAYENGYWCSRSGSYHSLIPGAAKEWGLPVQGCGKTEGQRIVDALSQGKLVVAIMLKGHFTSSGHFIVLRGVENGKILVADPANYTRSQQAWDLSIILNEASGRAGAGGPFWIIG